MSYEEVVCYECDETITEPICEECFEKEVYRWISEKKIDHTKKKEILALLNRTVNDVRLLPESEFFCVICFQKMHNICAYCLMKQTYETIGQHVKEEEMMLIFNYKINYFGLQRT